MTNGPGLWDCRARNAPVSSVQWLLEDKNLPGEQLVNHLSTPRANWITANFESLWESIATPALRGRGLKAASRTPDEYEAVGVPIGT